MSRQLRLVLVLFCTVLLLGAAIIVLDATKPKAGQSNIVFRDSPPTDIRSVEINNEYGNVQIDYMDGGYVIGNVPIDIVDFERFVEMMTHGAAVYAVDMIKNPDEIAQYGLDNKETFVNINYLDGESLKIVIGNLEPVSKAYYGMVEGENNVYLFEQERISAFLQPEKYYVSQFVTPPKPAQSQSSLGHVLAIEFVGGGLEEPVSLKPVTTSDEQAMLEILSFGSATHLITLRDQIHRVDQGYLANVLDSLVGLTATEVIYYNLSIQEINEFGFNNPYMQVRFDFRKTPDIDTVEYKIAIIEKNGEYFATCNNRGVIYKISPPYFLTIELEKLPVRWFFSPILFDLDELMITTGDEAFLFILTGTTNTDLSVTCNGEDFDLDRFRRLFKLVSSAAHDNTMTDQVVQSENPVMQITYKYREEKKQDDTLNLYTAQARRQYAEVNGIVEFTIKEQFYTRVLQALNVLYTDETFEIEW